MSNVRYRVFLTLEELDPVLKKPEGSITQFECATFSSREEARSFIAELLHNHCACAAGEGQLLAEMTAPEFFTAGD